MLGIDPRPFQFYQVMLMRHGREFESWDRLAFSTAYAASFVGVKNVKVENYHKFMIKKPKGIKRDELEKLKRYF